MKLFITFIILAVYVLPVHSQTCLGDVVLTTQTEVDAFDCETVKGTLLITGPDVTSLIPLRKLKYVEEHLILQDLPSLESMAGLENVTDVTCSFEIKSCDGLTSLDGLSSLSTIGRNLTVIDCDNLTSLDGLTNVKSLMNLQIWNNPVLSDCCILNSFLDAVTGETTIYGNAASCSLEGLSHCGSDLKVCVGDILITTQAEMDAFDCEKVIGNVTINPGIANNDPVFNIENLSTLTEVTGDLRIYEIDGPLDMLTNLKTVRLLQTVDVELDLSTLSSLEQLWGIDTRFTVVMGSFPKLSGTLNYVAFETFSSLEDPEWMGNVDHVRRLGIDITNSVDLGPSFQLLRNGGSLFLLGVKDFDGLQHIDSLSFLDMQAVNPPNFDQLSGLVFADTLIVRDNFEFPQEYCGLYPVLANRNASSVFRWENNSVEVNEILAVCGDEEIVCVGDILISTQAEMDAFYCNKVVGNITIDPYRATSDPVVNMDNLSSLQEVTGNLSVYNYFKQLTGVRNLVSAGRINLVDSHINLDSLTSLEKLQGIDTRFAQVKGSFPKLSGTLNYVAFETFSSLEDPEWMGNVDHVRRLGIDITNSVDLGPSFQLLRNGGSLFLLGVKDFDGLQHIDSLSFLDMQAVNPPNFDQLSGLVFADTLIVRDNFEFPQEYCGLYPVLANRNASLVFRWENNSVEVNEILAVCGDEEIVCEENIYITSQAELDDFFCDVIEGNLWLEIYTSVINTESLARMKRVTGDILFRTYTSELTGNGFRNLEYVGGHLEFESKFDLSEFTSLKHTDRLTFANSVITGDFPVLADTLDRLTMVLSEIDGTVRFNQLPAINRINLASYTQVYVPGLDKLVEGGYLRINYFFDPEGLDISALSGIEYLSAVLIDNATLKSYDGLETLKKVDDLDFRKNSIVGDCCGLYNFLTSGIITHSFLYEDNSCSVEEIIASCAPEEVLAEMSVYPNPVASNSIDVEWAGNPDVSTTVQVIDNSGREVSRATVEGSQGRQHLELEISKLEQGFYLIRIVTGEDVQLRRLIRH